MEVGEHIRTGIARAPLLNQPRVRATVSIGMAIMTEGRGIKDLFAGASSVHS